MRKKHALIQRLKLRQTEPSAELDDGSRVAVMGGGPAGAFFSYFLLEMAQRRGITLQVDIYEPRVFTTAGPRGCNMGGGVISESLVQTLAVQGINLAPTLVQQGIESYVLHMSEGSARLDPAMHEARIAALFRGAGPRDLKDTASEGLDGFLQKLAMKNGARMIHERVTAVDWHGDKPQIRTKDGVPQTYDLLAVAVGVNSPALRLFKGMGLTYRPPSSTKTFIREYHLGAEKVEKYLGSSMHLFLLDIPRLQFAAAIPKGDYVTVVLLGKDIDMELIQKFLHSSEVRRIMPPDWDPDQVACHCSPHMYARGAVQPFGDRLVFIGDCAANRLYKDGIGGAYRTAKVAASTAIFQGVSADAFRRHYWPTCRAIDGDNTVGRFMFWFTRQIQRRAFARLAVLRMIVGEQANRQHSKRMSMVLWDMFSGSAPYREIFFRILHPLFLSGLLWNTIASIVHSRIPQLETHWLSAGGHHAFRRFGQRI